MSLKQRPLPIQARRALLASRALLRRGEPSPADLLRTGLTLPLFVIDAGELQGAPSLEVFLGRTPEWRVQGIGPGMRAVAVDLRRAGKTTFAGIGRGQPVEKAIRVAMSAADMARGREFELCVVSIPDVRWEAYWLRPRDGSDPGRLIPFLQYPEEDRGPFEPGEFLHHARVAAEEEFAMAAEHPPMP